MNWHELVLVFMVALVSSLVLSLLLSIPLYLQLWAIWRESER